jgi:hypothetical protein
MTLAGVVAMAVAAASPAFAANTVSGSAYGASVNATVAGINVNVGPLPQVSIPATGGTQSTSLAASAPAASAPPVTCCRPGC